MEVYKFGGSSLANPRAFCEVMDIIAKGATKRIVVVSAMQGVTDCLVELCEEAAKGQFKQKVIEEISRRHEEVIDTLCREEDKSELKQIVTRVCTELHDLANSLVTIRDLSTKVKDRVISKGEYLSSRILTASLVAKSHNASWRDGKDLIEIVSKHGVSFPNLETTAAICQKELIPLFDKSDYVVVPGFVGHNPEGELITLGRGGTDLSGAILAAVTKADSLTLFKEVDGLMTADPRIVPEAKIVERMHYREATELAYYGAKILHPRTIIPLIEANIPLRIKNTFHPDRTGTEISGDAGPSEFPVKALSAINGQSILSIEGNGMMGVPGIAGRAFTSLANKDISVTLISQASSESSICFTIDSNDAKQAITALEDAFVFERQQKLIERIEAFENQSIIALVGMGMDGTRGIASQAFSALAEEGVNIQAIAQGSSELNISLVIHQEEKDRALKALHRAFRLEKFRTTHSAQPGTAHIHVYGFGQIGRTLGSQLDRQHEYYKEKLGINCVIDSLSDSSSLLLSEKGYTYKQIDELAKFKSKGGKLSSKVGYSSVESSLENFQKKIFSVAYDRGVFVDLTAADTAPILKEALKAKLHVVLANKKPLAIPYDDYKDLLATAESHGVQLRYEATVGAGLPVLDTIKKMEEVGDSIKRILGCFSGTLGYIMSSLEAGQSFSAAVSSAFSNGFTEPDPREDLSGADVARKALILARTLGYTFNMEDIKLESLFADKHSHDDPLKFIENLKEADEEWNAKVSKAKGEQKVVRYVARIEKSGISVGVELIDKKSPIGQLKGTDNLIQIQTNMYDENPLVLTGPGAGAEVTAAGVLNDIMAIATRKERKTK